MKAMKSFVMVFVFAGCWAQCLAQVGGGSVALPSDPAEDAKLARATQLIEDATSLLRAGNDQGAISMLNQAAEVEASMQTFYPRAKYRLARIYVKQNRIADALAAYRACFTWYPRAQWGGIKRADIKGGGIQTIMEYAILLAKEGRAEDAKAMYYYGLRSHMGPMSRSQEPAPFLLVFDPDAEGNYWEYTPQRLEAAAFMVQAMLTDGVTDFASNVRTTVDQLVERALALNPDWFYPVLFNANRKNLDSSSREQLTTQAETMARPGLERQLVARFRQDIAELLVINEQNDTPGAWDRRPMREGAERRKRMQCLRPNEQILRRLSIERPQ